MGNKPIGPSPSPFRRAVLCAVQRLTSDAQGAPLDARVGEPKRARYVADVGASLLGPLDARPGTVEELDTFPF